MASEDLIKQYVDTGLELPDYQIELLPRNMLKTYIRKRLIAVDNDDFNYRLKECEYKHLSDEKKIVYLNILLDKIYKDEGVMMLLMINSGGKNLSEWEFNEVGNYLGKEKQKEYIFWKIKKGRNIEDWEFNELDHDEKVKLVKKLNDDENPSKANHFKRIMLGYYGDLYETIKRHKDILGYGK